MGKRTVNSIKNMASGIMLRFGTLSLNFLSRYVFIKFLGEECLGLNGLFTTILTLFSLADLGIGDAITYYMYKPISERNEEKLRQLVSFYKVCYRIIGFAILVMGIALIPILPAVVNLEIDIGYNIYLIYILYLLNTVITYVFFSYSLTVLNANQQQYVVNNINTLFTVIIFVGDFVTLFFTHNYIVYLAVRLLLSIGQNGFVYLTARKKYKYITEKPLDKIEKNEIRTMFKDVYSIFVVKLSSRLIEATDNIFISVFLGTVKVGYNSNYLMFTNAAMSIVNTIVYSFGAGVGDLAVSGDKKALMSVFKKIDYINFCISFFCSVCLFSFLNPFITLLWGESFTFSTITVAFISFNFFITTSLYTTFLFRQSLGLFQYYKYNMLFTAITNIILDFVLVRIMNVAGLYLATIISSLLFGVWPFIKNVFEKGFGINASTQIKKVIIRYVYIILVGVVITLLDQFFEVNVAGFILRILVTLSIIAVAITITGVFDDQFRLTVGHVFRVMKGKK